MKLCSDWTSTMARKSEINAYLMIIYEPRKSVSARLT